MKKRKHEKDYEGGCLPIEIIPAWLLKAESGIDRRGGHASDSETQRAMLARFGVWQWPEDLIKEGKNQ